MILNPFSYSAPESLQEAVALLAVNGSEVFTGDHAHVSNAKKGTSRASGFVSLRKIPALKSIVQSGLTLEVGSAVTFSTLLAHDGLASFPVLSDALSASGDPHVRNHSTVGGALYLNTPGHGPVLAALTVLNAEVVIQGAGGSRTTTVQDYFAAGGSSGLTGGEILTKIKLTAREGAIGSFHYIDYLKSGKVACGIALSFIKQDNAISDISIAVSGCVPTPARLTAVETSLAGNEINEENVNTALRLLTPEVLPVSSTFISNPSYLLHLTKVLVKRAILKS
jgi:CO/xanthine dehydrogenase FAD-binding subunit